MPYWNIVSSRVDLRCPEDESGDSELSSSVDLAEYLIALFGCRSISGKSYLRYLKYAGLVPCDCKTTRQG
jgi:hypothetical protein